MNKRILLLLALLLSLCMTAHAGVSLPSGVTAVEDSAFEGDTSLRGVITLPSSLQTLGSRAFSGTKVHALVIPASCITVGSDVLSGGQAAYVTLKGATEISADVLTDVPYVFAPTGSPASGLSGYRSSDALATQDGLYYAVTSDTAEPLCARDGTAVSGTVTIPKLVSDVPVRSLSSLTLKGCSSLTELRVPAYLSIPEGLTKAVPYETMTLSAPVTADDEVLQGKYSTWTTEATGAYGEVSYIWTFTNGSNVASTITTTPSVKYAAMEPSTLTVSVTAEDALGDSASATGATVTVGERDPEYRALLIGNTYAGTDQELPGCDNDAYAMRTMLASMTRTPYSVTLRLNQNSSSITSSIASAFSGAQPGDISLFYFAGHGADTGALIGTNNTAVTPRHLRTALDKIPGTKIVILDCCYSGSFINKSTDGSGSPSSFNSAIVSAFSYINRDDGNLAANGYQVLTACRKDETSDSLVSGNISFGAFTYSVCYGSGYDEWNQVSLGNLPADANGDGAITLGEARSGVSDRIAYLNTILPLSQSVQYHGDTGFVLWRK